MQAWSISFIESGRIDSNFGIDHAVVFRVNRYRCRNGALVGIYRQQVGLEVIRVLHVPWVMVWVRLRMNVERVGWAHDLFLHKTIIVCLAARRVRRTGPQCCVGAHRQPALAIDAEPLYHSPTDWSMNESNFKRQVGEPGEAMPEALVLSSQSAAVLTLTLNRPLALNSFTGEMHTALMTALNEAAADVSVRCVVITGAGRGFCAGQDLSDPAVAHSSAPGAAPVNLRDVIDRHYTPLLARMQSMPVPLIAAVNGVAAGAGANFALACDLVVAAENASFIQAFSKIGLIPDTGGTWVLQRLVGRARAMGLAMTGDKLSALEAERIGMIWKCVPAEALTAEVQTLANKLAAMPTAALVATRHAFLSAAQMDLDAALEAEAQAQSALGFAHDYQEGVAAFQAKRAAVFTDR